VTPGDAAKESRDRRNNAGAAFRFFMMAYFPYERWHCRQSRRAGIAEKASRERRDTACV
jgi:hypothetical protein